MYWEDNDKIKIKVDNIKCLSYFIYAKLVYIMGCVCTKDRVHPHSVTHQEDNTGPVFTDELHEFREDFERLRVIKKSAAGTRIFSNEYIFNESNKIGSGHYGVVILGIHKKTGTKVAIKTVEIKNRHYVVGLRNEIRILQTITHPNIVRLYDIFESETRLRLVFELCNGEELFDKITETPENLSEMFVAKVIRDLLITINYLHKRDIVHRDLKPENIMLSSNVFTPQIKLIDFGLAVTCTDETVLTDRVGTPYYMAPEVIDKSYGKKCDLWSIGIICYVMLSKRPPFAGHTTADLYHKIRNAELEFTDPIWSFRSTSSRMFIMKLLERTVYERYSAEDALCDPWIHYGGLRIKQLSDYRIFKKIFNRIRNYAAFPFIKRISIKSVVKTIKIEFFTEKFGLELMVFKYFSYNKNYITIYDIAKRLVEQDYPFREHEIIDLFRLIDIDEDEILNFYEMAAAIIPTHVYTEDGIIMSLFREFDINKDGLITLSDIQALTGDTGDLSREIFESGLLEHEHAINYATFMRIMCGGELVYSE